MANKKPVIPRQTALGIAERQARRARSLGLLEELARKIERVDRLEDELSLIRALLLAREPGLDPARSTVEMVEVLLPQPSKK